MQGDESVTRFSGARTAERLAEGMRRTRSPLEPKPQSQTRSPAGAMAGSRPESGIPAQGPSSARATSSVRLGSTVGYTHPPPLRRPRSRTLAALPSTATFFSFLENFAGFPDSGRDPFAVSRPPTRGQPMARKQWRAHALARVFAGPLLSSTPSGSGNIHRSIRARQRAEFIRFGALFDARRAPD